MILLFVLVCCARLLLADIEPLNINGVVAAVFTPFNDDFSLNLNIIPQYAKFLNETGVFYVFVAGTTGESLSLTVQERKELLEAWVQCAQEYGINVISHVGAESIEDAQELARHAEAQKVVAIGAMPPVFFKPGSIDALAETIGTIAQAAPNTPVYYYHIPSMTGVIFPMYDFVQKMVNVTNFVGVKYTGLYIYPSFTDVAKILNEEKYEVLCGREDMTLEAVFTGMVGFIGSQFNYAGELYNLIISQTETNDLHGARQSRMDALELLTLLEQFPNKNSFKFAMKLAGLDLGEARLPSLPLLDVEKQQLTKDVTKWCQQVENPLSWCSRL